MPKALILSRQFPPLNSAGSSIRLVKFLKYIRPEGWEFVVVTQDLEETIDTEERLSAFLEADIPAGTEVVRVKAPLRGLPGSSIGWALRAAWAGLRSLKQAQIDLLFTSAPTFTNALLGYVVCKLSGKPMVLDLKDDWVGAPAYLAKPVWRQRVERFFESQIVRAAARVVLVTEDSYQRYRDRYVHLNCPEKFHLVPNGCDLTEYEILAGRLPPPVGPRFTILSAAWGYRRNYRDITPFFLALSRFLQQYPAARSILDVVFLGNSLASEYDGLIAELGLKDVIQVEPPALREDLVERLFAANLLLLVQPQGLTTSISGTLYEYWAAGNAPVLCISEVGASSAIVDDNAIGRSFRFADLDGITAHIVKVYKAYLNQQPIRISSKGVAAFDRKNLAKCMAGIWKEALTPSAPP